MLQNPYLFFANKPNHEKLLFPESFKQMYDFNFLDEFRHPSTKILGTRSQRLEGKRIVLGITGSVAAFLSPQIARELIREGATVIPVMSAAALTMIGKDLMWWATGVEPITKVTGNLEHIYLAGVMNKPADLLLIAPCTTNTAAKLAAGIADTPVSLIASSLIGKGIPTQLLTVAHEDLINSPAIDDALAKLQSRGVYLIESIREEGKAKVPPIDQVIFEVLNILTPKKLKNKHVIITGGANREYIDNVRFITNGASGKSALALAKEAALHGAQVSLVLGEMQIPIPHYLAKTLVQVSSANEMQKAVLEILKEKQESLVFLSAAMADFQPEQQLKGKIKSDKGFSINLVATEKLSDQVKQIAPNSLLVVYKAEWDVSKEVLIERAREKMKKTSADLAIANDLAPADAGFATDTNNVLIIRKDGKVRNIKGLKSTIALEIIDLIIRKLLK